MPIISIIIPVYNVELYLKDCLNSILAQSYKDFEVLLINDGSSDKSGNICDEYAVIDNRIRVFHQKNSGVSSARNLGLREAKGEWICFVDSDDWIDNNTLEVILSAEDDSIDCVQFGFKQINNDEIIMQSSLPNQPLKIDKKTYFSKILFHSAICGYLIKTSVIRKNNICFPNNIKYGEDQAFILKALMCCHNIYILNERFYNYRYREGSAMNSSKTFSRAEDHLKVIKNICDFIISSRLDFMYLHKIIFKDLILNYIKIGIDSTYNIVKVKKIFSEYCKNISQKDIYMYCKKYDNYFVISNMYFKMKIQVLINKSDIFVKNFVLVK